MNFRHLLLIALMPTLTACDMLYELLEIPDPKKEAQLIETEGRAIGSACRHSGRSLEDCYLLNPKAQKAAVFQGWKEMNDYMLANGLESVPSQLTPNRLPEPDSAPEMLLPPTPAPDAEAGGDAV